MGQYLFGSLSDRVLKEVEEKQKQALIQQQLIKLKSMKRRRDYEIATRLATTRDRVWWLGGFYTVMGGVSFARMLYLRRFDPLPLNYLPYIIVPFWMTYLVDFAYGTKANRIDREARKILTQEQGHWFNEPIEIPELLKPHYHRIFEENNRKLISEGKEPEKHWAK
ncbi:hypothetical protein FDP41_012759 [Naegleria fowleri]|uniref:Uncharacterized protein n=1 Tax=Naegleria fowleri TaxID=5763 RepID=A0A6A5C4P1_NAEFO|nr:uncharacterized protein FDP41_013321 [Naegleria fowleri]XP_044565684.1 uncharacterized protein FDP41_012759 [Naegleria fowleri]KAF0980838.1 hypothetical protein FDP41_013321 [Naegleria fowleri]KAF0980971.1 hypothetical protein FDP41_012759 [Naegleria fowleri]